MGELLRWPLPAPAGAERAWWLLWSRCPGVGVVRLRQLGAAYGGLDVAWAAPADALAARMGWPGALLAAVERFREHWGPDPLPRLLHGLRGGRGVLVPGDPRWPAAMEQGPRPPLALYWRGRGSLWRPLALRRAVAVVGTRRPSPHGLAMARRLGARLAAAGWPVVSGLAEGIDGAAHEGCLAAGGAPVAVLGTPLQRVYPRHHAVLQRQVGRQGLLVSELPPGSSVRAGHFASRNRLQVALAAAVVLVECPQRSGALLTADLAWQQGLPLWVVPADAAKVSAVGSNRLLARGATPLLEAEELIDMLGGPGPLAPARQRTAALTALPGPLPEGRGGEARGAWSHRLLQAVGEGASLEQLTLALGRPGEELAASLLELELAGVLRAEPGLRWGPTGRGDGGGMGSLPPQAPA